MPGPERDVLQRVTPLVWPLAWVYTLPAPKDAPTALETLVPCTGRSACWR